MEKKRKRIHSTDVTKEAALVSSSTEQKMAKTIPDQQEKNTEQNHLNKPHMLFK